MTSAAAMGYMILAAKKLNVEKEMIESLEVEMRLMMDEKTVEEARIAYYEN